MRKSILTIIALTAVAALGQQASPPTFVKGNMGINFGASRDDYTIDFNVCNSTRFHGGIAVRHYVPAGYISAEVPLGITYALDCDVLKPGDPSVSRNVGQMCGGVKVNGAGVYDYDGGTLECSVIPTGNAQGMDSFFRGKAQGKPLSRPPTWDWHNLSQSAVNISRIINGKVSTVTLNKYDQMRFDDCVLCGGPLMSYQKVHVNGLALYDYEKNTWFLKDMTVAYVVGQQEQVDHLSGNVRWVPDPDRLKPGTPGYGLSRYDFDVKVNEPMPSEDQVFAPSTQDEDSFFQKDEATPGLSGTFKYKDTLTDTTPPYGTTSASQIQVDLEGNKLTKQQAMVVFKLFVLQMVVPMNND